MKHVLPGTPLSFKVERILNRPRRGYSPNLRQHGCQCSWVDFCLVVLLSYFSDCEVQASSVGDWIRIAIKILHMFWFVISLFKIVLQSPPPVTKACTAELSFRPSVCLTVCERKKKMCRWGSRKAQLLWINSKSGSHRTAGFILKQGRMSL